MLRETYKYVPALVSNSGKVVANGKWKNILKIPRLRLSIRLHTQHQSIVVRSSLHGVNLLPRFKTNSGFPYSWGKIMECAKRLSITDFAMLSRFLGPASEHCEMRGWKLCCPPQSKITLLHNCEIAHHCEKWIRVAQMFRTNKFAR